MGRFPTQNSLARAKSLIWGSRGLHCTGLDSPSVKSENQKLVKPNFLLRFSKESQKLSFEHLKSARNSSATKRTLYQNQPPPSRVEVVQWLEGSRFWADSKYFSASSAALISMSCLLIWERKLFFYDLRDFIWLPIISHQRQETAAGSLVAIIFIMPCLLQSHGITRWQLNLIGIDKSKNDHRYEPQSYLLLMSTSASVARPSLGLWAT